MSKLSNIPTNIITGFLGVGKTTSINSLLKKKPEDETWAILVNEFGQIGIDQAVMENIDGIAIKELVGGCICCALGPALTSTLATLIRTTRPDRLIIEPTGIGHPAGIIDSLQSNQFREVLDLRSIICLLDPRALSQAEVSQHPTFQDQLNLADIVLINKADLAEPEQLKSARSFTEQLYPAKQQVLETTQGEINIALLDYVRNDDLSSQFPHAHDQQRIAGGATGNRAISPLPIQLQPQAEHPLSKSAAGNGLFSCGWVFSADDRFTSTDLFDYLNKMDMQRIKGVFHTDKGWQFYNRTQDDTTVSPIAYRRDSRVEIISVKAEDWQQIEAKLKAFIIGS